MNVVDNIGQDDRVRSEKDAATAFMCELPPSIRIGYCDYTIKPEVEQNCWGRCSNIEAVIFLKEGHPSPAHLVDTFYHEIGHAIWYLLGLRNTAEEERIVATFASAMVGVYRDNPWLLDWVTRALHREPLSFPLPFETGLAESRHTQIAIAFMGE